jgi:hypothetical protein
MRPGLAVLVTLAACRFDGGGVRDDDGGGPDAGPPPVPWRKLAAAVAFACGVKDDGTLWCWGECATCQLGTGD